MGYKFQFVTLAGFHSLNFGMFELASGYAKRGMASYAELQQVRTTLCATGVSGFRQIILCVGGGAVLCTM